MTKATSPADLAITPRDLRFGRGRAMKRWWLNDDPFATAFYNALSVTFPKGEAFFVDSVRAFRDGAAPKLAGEIQAFIKQEVLHTREHVAFNRHVTDAFRDERVANTCYPHTVPVPLGSQQRHHRLAFSYWLLQSCHQRHIT